MSNGLNILNEANNELDKISNTFTPKNFCFGDKSPQDSFKSNTIINKKAVKTALLSRSMIDHLRDLTPADKAMMSITSLASNFETELVKTQPARAKSLSEHTLVRWPVNPTDKITTHRKHSRQQCWPYSVAKEVIGFDEKKAERSS